MKTFTRTIGLGFTLALAACQTSTVPATSSPTHQENPTTAAAVAAPSSAGGSMALDIAKSLQRSELKNGLHIVVREDHTLPIVTTTVAYAIGAVYEAEGLTGATHFLEHMLFKEFGDHDEKFIDDFTARAGGINNAFTTEDCTCYWFTVPNDKWQDVLAIEADRMRNSKINAEPFEREKGAVMQELARRMDSPSGQLYQEIDKAAFSVLGYHHPVLGWEKDLTAMKAEDLRRFYNQYYWPNNATLVVVGDVKAGDVFAAAEKCFGPIPGKGAAPKIAGPEPAQANSRAFELKTQKEQNRVAVAFRTDKIATEADYTLDLVSAILSHGKDSRLYRRLVETEKLATEDGIEAMNNTRSHDGLYYVFAELRQGADPKRTVDVILDELNKLKTEGVTAHELEKAKNIVSAGFVFSKENQSSLAQDLGRFFAMGAPDYIDTYLDRINAITADTIRGVAARHFTEQNRTVGTAWAAGRTADDEFKPRAKWGHRMATSQDGFHLPSLGEQYEITLRNGLTVIVKPRRETGLPIVYMRGYVNSNPAFDPKGKEGLARIVGEALDQGTSKFTNEQIAAETDFRGAELSTDVTGVQLRVLKRDEDFAYDLLAEMMLRPTFTDARVAFVRENAVEAIKSMQDDPATLSRVTLREQVYRNHPLGHGALGWEKSVASITRDDVVAYHKKYFRPDNAIIVVVGDVTPEKVVLEMRRRFLADWPVTGTLQLPQIPPVARQSGPVAHYLYKQTQQVNVSFGYAGVTRENPDFEALLVAEYCLWKGPGFTDRLTKDVRVKNGLAYEVWGDVTRSADWWQSLGIAYYGTPAAKKDKAWEVAHACIDGFIKIGPEPEELEMARGFVLRSFAFRWQTYDAIANYLIACKRYRLGTEFPIRFERAVRAVTAEDVKRVAQKYLSADDVTMVVVGPVDDKGNVIQVKHDPNEHK